MCTDNRILERVNTFTYLGYTMSYQGKGELLNKTAKYTKAMGIINNIQRISLEQRHVQLCRYITFS
jgi:hypothetical protein